MAGLGATVYHRGGQSWQQKSALCLALLNVCNVPNHEV